MQGMTTCVHALKLSSFTYAVLVGRVLHDVQPEPQPQTRARPVRSCVTVCAAGYGGLPRLGGTHAVGRREWLSIC